MNASGERNRRRKQQTPAELVMHSTHGSLGAASVARLAPIGLVALLVAALVNPGSSHGGVPAAARPRPSATAASGWAGTTPGPTPSPDWSQTTAATTPKAVAGAPLVASSTIVATGIPATALDAYHRAAGAAAVRTPACGISWALLAGIGRMESDHGRFGGAVLYSTGVSSRPIIGPALNGNGTALILDTDHGYYDRDTVYDHAVGPMQFIPSTWARWGVDGNADGHRDPFNVYDAAGAAAAYLCAAGGDLRTVAGQTRAVFAYNHVPSYVAAVLALEAAYAAGRSGAVIPAVAPPAVSAPAPAPTHSPSPTPRPSPSPSPSPSCSPSSSPSGSPTPSGSGSGTSPTPSGSPSDSPTPTPSPSPSPSPSTSPSPSPNCG